MEQTGQESIKKRLRSYSASDKREGEQSTPLNKKESLVISEPRPSLAKYKYQSQQLPTTPEVEEQARDSSMDPKELGKLPPHGEMTTEQWWNMLQQMNAILVGLKGNKGTVTNQALEDRLDQIEESICSNEMKINIMSNIIIAQDQEIQDLRFQLKNQKKQKSMFRLKISGLLEEANENKADTQGEGRKVLQRGY